MKIIVIGAGLAGLGAGIQLNRADADFKILESCLHGGGLARSDIFNGFSFDYTGHFLHTRSEEGFQDLICNATPMIKIKKRSAVIIENVVVPYPIQYNLKYIPSAIVVNIVKEVTAIQNSNEGHFNNLAEYLEGYFGETLFTLFFKPYNEKLWGKSLNMLPPDCLGNYFPRIDLPLLLDGCKKETEYKGYNDFFYYPQSGSICSLPDALAAQIKDKITYSTRITEIDIENKVCYDSTGKDYRYDSLIHTMPLNKIAEVTNASLIKSNLGFGDIKNVRVIFKGRILHHYHWFYIPDKNVPFYRIGFPQNVIAISSAKEGHVSLSIEVNVAFNNYTDEEIAELAIEYLDQKKLLQCEKLHSFSAVTITPAYTYIKQDRKSIIENFQSFLSNHSIYSAGRYALWKYFSMEDAYLSGINAAKFVVSKKMDVQYNR